MAFRRIKQRATEAMGKAEKTTFDQAFDVKVQLAETTKEQVDKVIERVEAVVQPDPTLRASSGLNPSSLSKLEALGQCFATASAKFGADSDIGAFFHTASEIEMILGEEERNYIRKVDYYVLNELKKFLNEDYKAFAKEKKTLNNKRLDMDIAKNKIRKAEKNQDMQRLEEKLKETTAAFEDQADVVVKLLEQYPQHHEDVKTRLIDFLKAQAFFHRFAADKLQKYLKSLNATD